MLIDDLRTKINDAVRTGDEVTRDVLRLVLGEMESIRGSEKSKGVVTDEQGVVVIKQMLKNNRITLDALTAREGTAGADSTDQSRRDRLEAENAVLERFLPKTIPLEDIKNRLAAVSDQIVSAKSDGQAIGLAMKHLKGAGVQALGEDVKSVVGSMRGAMAVT